MTNLSSIFNRYKNHAPLLIGLLLTAPVIFFQAFRFSFPLGYAGMFTLISEQIAKGNFALPMSVPHYGPGGIPLVYPPFAMYVFALAIKMGISTWAYMRLAPALFTLLCVILLYYLTVELVESKIAGMVAVVLVMTAPTVYYTHVWAAGVVRALAFAFCLAGLLFYVRALKNFSWRSVLLAGISLGLLLITHWLYVAFAALVGVACIISEWKPARIPTALGILAIALLLAAPWLGLIVARHGLANILAASSSHRNMDFLTSLQQINAAMQFLGENLKYVTGNWWLTALTVPGIIMLLVRKKFQLPLAFLFVLFMGEDSFYSVILAGMIAGTFSADVFQQIAKINEPKQPVFIRLSIALLVILTTGAVLFSAGKGLAEIAQYEPEIDSQSLQMAAFVRKETAPEFTYLYIGGINEAEWFPYLLDRTPVFAMWGSEWKGTYAEQLNDLVALRACQLQKDWACMENLQKEQNVSPDLVISPNQRWLMLQIKDTDAWELIFTNDRYLVWKKLE